jgi:hypothetical protein
MHRVTFVNDSTYIIDQLPLKFSIVQVFKMMSVFTDAPNVDFNNRDPLDLNADVLVSCILFMIKSSRIGLLFPFLCLDIFFLYKDITCH